MKLKIDYIECNGHSSFCETDALDSLMDRINEELSYYNPVNILGVQIFKVEDSIYQFDFSAIVTYTIYEN